MNETRLRELLVSRGIRVTGQRMALLRELAKSRVPTSHAELTDRMTGTSLDRATIYRNLVSLHEAGILVRSHIGDDVSRYELEATGDAHSGHPHFVCTDCGDIECLASNTVSLRGKAKDRRVTEVSLRGRCADCANP